MRLDEDARKKYEELVQIVNSTISSHTSQSEQISRKIVSNFSSITPPEIQSGFELSILEQGGIGGGRNIKPGNILLNWKRLLIDSADIALTISGSISIPWLVPLAGLVVWNKIWSLLNIEIDERHAVVLWTMWQNKDDENKIERKEILKQTNKTLRKHNRREMNKAELKLILDDLERMQCIERSNHDKLRLREWIKTRY
jgi:hypothetical protein